MRFSQDDKGSVSKGICENIKHICKDFGKRIPASDEERIVANEYADRLKNVVGDVTLHEFDVYPSAHWGWLPISGVLGALAFVAHFFTASVAVLLVVCAFVPFVVQFLLQSRFFDVLYAKKKSCNVIAKKACTRERKKSLYLVADIDASNEWYISYKLGGTVSLAVIFIFVFSLLYTFAVSIAKWVIVGELGAQISSGGVLMAGLAGCLLLPAQLVLQFFVSHKRYIDSANENLTGSEVAVAVLENLKDVEIEDTDINVILCGSSSCGSRGIRAWLDENKDKIDKENSVFLVLNNLREIDHICVNANDWHALVNSDQSIVDGVLASAKKCGVDCKSMRTFGTSDSGAISRRGFKSASLSAVRRRSANYLHTRYDSADNLSTECIGECLQLVAQYVDDVANISNDSL